MRDILKTKLKVREKIKKSIDHNAYGTFGQAYQYYNLT